MENLITACFPGRWYVLTAAEWAAWVQAFGSIAAILGAFAIANGQHQKERRLEKERRNLAELRGYEVIRTLMEIVNLTTQNLLGRIHNSPLALVNQPEAAQLADFARSIRELPLFELPHRDLVIFCTSVPRAIDGVLPVIAECETAVILRGVPDFGMAENIADLLEQILNISNQGNLLCIREIARIES